MCVCLVVFWCLMCSSISRCLNECRNSNTTNIVGVYTNVYMSVDGVVLNIIIYICK